MTTVQRTASPTPELHVLHPSHFAYRHIGPRRPDVGEMLAVMGYDSGLYLPRAYAWLMREQVVHATRAARRGNPHCRALIGVPTYARGGASHHAWSENPPTALLGVREGLADPRTEAASFAGVALFADAQRVFGPAACGEH